MTSHSTGPFDPIAGAPDPDDPGPRTRPPGGPLTGPPSGPMRGAFTGPPSGPLTGAFTGPPSGPFTVDHRSRMGAEPPDHHHEAGRPDAVGGGVAHHEPAAGYRAGAPVPEQVLRSGEAAEDDQLWAMVAYLGVIFFAFLPPLTVFLLKRHESRFVRFHAAQALNLWITAFLYALSFVIIGGILALDTIGAALAVGVPLIALAGAAMLLYAVRAAAAAGRGRIYELPGWICVPMVT